MFKEYNSLRENASMNSNGANCGQLFDSAVTNSKKEQMIELVTVFNL